VTTAKVLDHKFDTSLVLLNPILDSGGCGSCLKECGNRKEVTAWVPGSYSSEIKLSLSLHNQTLLLLHSILFPLIGFLVGGAAGEWAGSNDLVVAGCSAAGLFVGMKFCKKQSFEKLIISENEDE
jgi:hypothetical protein